MERQQATGQHRFHPLHVVMVRRVGGAQDDVGPAQQGDAVDAAVRIEQRGQRAHAQHVGVLRVLFAIVAAHDGVGAVQPVLACAQRTQRAVCVRQQAPGAADQRVRLAQLPPVVRQHFRRQAATLFHVTQGHEVLGDEEAGAIGHQRRAVARQGDRRLQVGLGRGETGLPQRPLAPQRQQLRLRDRVAVQPGQRQRRGQGALRLVALQLMPLAARLFGQQLQPCGCGHVVAGRRERAGGHAAGFGGLALQVEQRSQGGGAAGGIVRLQRTRFLRQHRGACVVADGHVVARQHGKSAGLYAGMLVQVHGPHAQFGVRQQLLRRQRRGAEAGQRRGAERLFEHLRQRLRFRHLVRQLPAMPGDDAAARRQREQAQDRQGGGDAMARERTTDAVRQSACARLHGLSVQPCGQVASQCGHRRVACLRQRRGGAQCDGVQVAGQLARQGCRRARTAHAGRGDGHASGQRRHRRRLRIRLRHRGPDELQG